MNPHPHPCSWELGSGSSVVANEGSYIIHVHAFPFPNPPRHPGFKPVLWHLVPGELLFDNRPLPGRDPNPALTWILGLIYIPSFRLARCLGELNMGFTFPFIV